MNEKEKYVLEHYDVREDGSIYSPYTNKILKCTVDKDGYFTVTLIYNNEGKRQPFMVHRLLALKFIPEVEGCPVVNHKDLNKQNNCLENLEWCTISRNTQHGFDNNAYENVSNIKVTEPNGNILIFPSQSHAARYYGYKTPATIQQILSGKGTIINPPKKGKCKGCFFEFTNESVTTIERVTDTVVSE